MGIQTYVCNISTEVSIRVDYGYRGLCNNRSRSFEMSVLRNICEMLFLFFDHYILLLFIYFIASLLFEIEWNMIKYEIKLS